MGNGCPDYRCETAPFINIYIYQCLKKGTAPASESGPVMDLIPLKNHSKIPYLSPFNNGECWSKHLSCLCLQKYSVYKIRKNTCQKYRRKKNIHPTCSVYPGVHFVLILLNWQAKVTWTPKDLPSVLVEAVPTASGPLGLTPWTSAGGHDEPCVLKLGNWFKICYAKHFDFKVTAQGEEF